MKMKKKLMNISAFLLGSMSLLLINPTATAAKEYGIGFSVDPILPATQVDKDLGYYYLETTPGKEQTFEVKLFSQEKEKQTIQMFVQDAYTGTTGNLSYGVDGEEGFVQDKTLIDPTSQIITPMSETIELEPGEEKVVTFKVTPPQDSYPGAKIGRLVFKPVDEDAKGESAVVETYQYGVSIILSENGDDYNDGDIQSIALNEVKATVKRGRRMVTANLQNPQPKRILNLDLNATVTKKGDKKAIKQTKIPEFQFAPNSNVDLEVDWGLSELEAGEYTLTISGKNDYDEIHLTKDFRVTSEAARKINKDSAFKIETPTWVKMTAISSGVLTVGLSVVIIIRNKKWAKQVSKKRNRKKRNKKK